MKAKDHRVLVLCSHMELDGIEAQLFQQQDDEVLAKLFNPDVNTPESEILNAAIGCSSAGKTLACDFALINPPEIYREALETALCAVGIVPVYPVYGVSKDGMVVSLGYRNADRIPEPHSTPQLADRYRRWLESHYYNIAEKDLVYVPDPWRTFVRFATKGVFKHRTH